MNTFLALAFVVSLAGSVAGPVGAVLFKSYQDERKRIEAGHEPTYLSYTTEEIYEQLEHRHPEVVEEKEGSSLGKTYALPVKIEAVTEAATEQSIRSEDIISKAAATTLSIVFTAPPGCGKTTTELAWLARVFDLYPDARVLITSQKNDSFLGLSEIPGVLAVLDGIDPKPLADQIDRVFNILQQRKSLPSSRRHEYQGQPVWLLLGDWFATCNSLANNKRYSELWNDIKTKIGLIITVGREFLVGIACDTHSFNTSALGIANDANIRDCLNIMALGKISRNQDGQEQGGYGAIAKAIGNKLVVDDDTIRSQLLKELTHMALLSDQTGRPVLFTTMGHPPRMMLLPDLRQYETYRLPAEILTKVANCLNTPNEVNSPQSVCHQLDQRVINLKVSDDLAEPLKTIWLFCKEQTDWVSVREICRKDFAVLKGKNSNDIRRYLGLLNDGGYGELDSSGNAVRFRAY